MIHEIYVIQTPQCSWCGKTGTVEMTFADYMQFEHGSGLIQDRLPHVPADVREQLKTGYHPACWKEMFGGDDE